MTVPSKVCNYASVGNSSRFLTPPVVPQRILDTSKVFKHLLRSHKESPIPETEAERGGCQNRKCRARAADIRVVNVARTPVVTVDVFGLDVVRIILRVGRVVGIRDGVRAVSVHEGDIVEVGRVRGEELDERAEDVNGVVISSVVGSVRQLG